MADKDTTATAQGRFVVSLPAEFRQPIEDIGKRISAAVKSETDVEFELTPAQVVQSLVKTAVAAQEQGAASKSGK